MPGSQETGRDARLAVSASAEEGYAVAVYGDTGRMKRLKTFLNESEGERLPEEVGVERLGSRGTQVSANHPVPVGRDQEVKQILPKNIGGTVRQIGDAIPATFYLDQRSALKRRREELRRANYKLDIRGGVARGFD